MIQPFEKFKILYIAKLFELKKFYLVSQTYTRGVDHFADGNKKDILFTDYDDPGLAKIHFNAVKHDKYAVVIDLRNELHKAKIQKMLEPSSIYTVYWSIVKDVKEMERRLNKRYASNMQRYISKHTTWRIGADEMISPSFEVAFGELFITLKRGSQALRVKFEEIEKC